MFVKIGDSEIIEVLKEGDEPVEDKIAQKALKKITKQIAKTSENGNNTESKEIEFNSESK